MKTVEALCEFKGPAYLRLTGGPGLPVVYEEDFDFRIGKAITLQEGKDIAIFASGTMVYYAREAAKLLAERGMDAAVIDMHTIKPLDADAVKAQLDKKLIVTVEEASVVGGLGSAVAECIAPEKDKPPQLMLGIRDCFPHAGSYAYLLEQCRLTAAQIAEDIAQAAGI